MFENVAIVGGGPAGSYLGYCLAQKGIYASIFDDSHPREKPCGGAISPFALRKFPILEGVPYSKFIGKMMVVSPRGRETMISVPKDNGMVVSRKHLDMYLLEQAINHGAKLIQERVASIERKSNVWLIRTRDRELTSGLVIGADGVNSVVRKAIVGRIPKQHIAACIGYFAQGFDKDYGIIRFLEGLNGYAWVFPGEIHSSIGVGSDTPKANRLRNYLNEFVEKYVPNMEKPSRFGALIPAIKDPGFFDIPCSGQNWILIGDAAGHVDPVTGEGILYALWSAELAAKAITEDDPSRFDTLWRSEYYPELVKACRLVRIAYNARVLEFAILVASRSKVYAQILAELIAKEQPYRGLLKRLITRCPRAVLDCTIR